MNPSRLYAWHPFLPGQLSFYVTAASEAEARAAVEAKMAELIAKGKRDDCWNIYAEASFVGWKTGDYQLTVVEEGVVLFNEND